MRTNFFAVSVRKATRILTSTRILPILILILQVGLAQEPGLLPGTKPLNATGDLSAEMVAGIHRFLLRQTEQSIGERQKLWHRDFSSAAAYESSIRAHREDLRKMIGAVDARIAGAGFEFEGGSANPLKVAETDAFTIRSVRWPVFEGVHGEGLLLQPRKAPTARAIVIPDADQTPEMLAGLAPGLVPERQIARRLAEQGCEVLVPVLIDRQYTWSGSAQANRYTNQPHREWIYRQAFMLGRHVIGYEVEKILAAVDAFQAKGSTSEARSHEAEASSGVGAQDPKSEARHPALGVVGYAEGGLIAFYSAALDTRIQAALVSGYFDSRQGLWEEPIYRNVFGLLKEFGDAEIATLIAPRALIVEHSRVPKVLGPPQPREGRAGAAPGKLDTPDYASVEGEFERARTLLDADHRKEFDHLTLISGTEGAATGPGADRALAAWLNALGVPVDQLKEPGQDPTDWRTGFDAAEQQKRQVKELEAFTQRLFRESAEVRSNCFWNRITTTSSEEWKRASAPFRTNFWEEVIGRLPAPTQPLNPRTRLLAPELQGATWTGYEVMLDVYPEVYAWGYLLVPKDLKPGERRPVVVCQHGLEGVPADVINPNPDSQAFRYYKAFAARLAEQGFITFAPHNPYRGKDKFRQLQRLANPLGKSLFSVIIAQHDRILDWLSGLPFVDADRLAFYGLSYGGKTAMRVPAVLDRYVLSVCSGDFNEWVRKNVSLDFPASYMFLNEYEMPEFNLGSTFNYAEMAALIAPRPFMVERGHQDPVGLDDWVAEEYAKVRRFYEQLGISDRTRIEFFDGPHTINGQGTFEFLHRELDWPKR